MNPDLLQYLQCPDCTSDLKLSDVLTCITCKAKFPLSEQGIPQLLPSALIKSSKDIDTQKKMREMASRDKQVGDYEKNIGLRLLAPIETPIMINCANPKKDGLFLEGGCGSGRMTKAFASKSNRVIAIDFSLSSLHVNQAKLKAAKIENVDLIQADISALPLKSIIFDSLVSCQVIEHLPSDAARVKAVSELSRVARPNAGAALSGYKYNIFMRLLGNKVGEHSGNIPFFRFTKREFVNLLENSFKVKNISGSLIYCWVAECTPYKMISPSDSSKSLQEVK